MKDPYEYFVFQRRMYDRPVWGCEPSIVKLYLYLFGHARYSEGSTQLGETVINKGDFVGSLAGIAEDNAYEEKGIIKTWSRSKVSRMLEKLEKIGAIKVQPNSNGTHVTICDYNDLTKTPSSQPNSNGTVTEQMRNRCETQPNSNGTQVNTIERIDKKDNIDNIDKKEKEDKYIVQAREVFDFWNSLSFHTTHNDESFDKMKKCIASKIKKYSLDEVLFACKTLNDACVDFNFYYKWKWSLDKFMTQKNGVANWINGGDLLTKYYDSLSAIKDAAEKKKADKARAELGSACDGVSDGVLAMVRFE